MIDKIIDWLDIKLCQLLIWRIKRGYGIRCETKDVDDFPKEDLSGARCPSCAAWEVIDWLEEYIKTIKMFM